MGHVEQSEYSAQASAYCKAAIVWWLIAGWVYAGVTWRFLFLPAILVFVPGIFVASLLAFALFLPAYFMKKHLAQWQRGEPKQWGLLIVTTLWTAVEFLGPIAGAIGFVEIAKGIIGD